MLIVTTRKHCTNNLSPSEFSPSETLREIIPNSHFVIANVDIPKTVITNHLYDAPTTSVARNAPRKKTSTGTFGLTTPSGPRSTPSWPTCQRRKSTNASDATTRRTERTTSSVTQIRVPAKRRGSEGPEGLTALFAALALIFWNDISLWDDL